MWFDLCQPSATILAAKGNTETKDPHRSLLQTQDYRGHKEGERMHEYPQLGSSRARKEDECYKGRSVWVREWERKRDRKKEKEIWEKKKWENVIYSGDFSNIIQ